MKFFPFSFLTLWTKVIYKFRVFGQKKSPDGIDQDLKFYIENWERKVHATIQGARKLLLSREIDQNVIRKYMRIMSEDAMTIERIYNDNPHPCYLKLVSYAKALRKFEKDLQEKISSPVQP